MKQSPLKTQEGGNHYKDMPIQIVEFNFANNLDYFQGNIIKYVCRYKKKNGKEDLLKARHYLDMYIEFLYGDKTTKNPRSTGKS